MSAHPSVHLNAGLVYLNALSLIENIRPPGPQHHSTLRTNATASTIFSALATETFINEVSYLANGLFRGTEGAWLQTLGDVLEELEDSHAPITSKYLIAKFVLSGAPFDKGKSPYQEFALLIRVRNVI